MFDFGCSAIIGAQQMAKIENARWNALTPEQQDRELYKREVEALESQARALEKARRDINHRLFF